MDARIAQTNGDKQYLSLTPESRLAKAGTIKLQYSHSHVRMPTSMLSHHCASEHLTWLHSQSTGLLCCHMLQINKAELKDKITFAHFKRIVNYDLLQEPYDLAIL